MIIFPYAMHTSCYVISLDCRHNSIRNGTVEFIWFSGNLLEIHKVQPRDDEILLEDKKMTF